MLCFGVIVANRAFHWDSDRGGYTPRISDKATFPKEYVHFVTGLAISGLLLLLGAPWWVLFIPAVSTYGWEWSQGYINRLDILFGILGLLIPVAVLAWRV